MNNTQDDFKYFKPNKETTVGDFNGGLVAILIGILIAIALFG